MYIHLDYKTLPLGEGEKHFAYIEITEKRQGILSCKKKIHSKLSLSQRTGSFAYPRISRVSQIFPWRSSNNPCPVHSKGCF